MIDEQAEHPESCTPELAGARPPVQAHNWQITPVDALTGELVPPDELVYRHMIAAEHGQGQIAIDRFYAEQSRVIHQSLMDEHGDVLGDSWVLRRANRVSVLVHLSDIENNTSTRENVAVAVAALALDDYAAGVMRTLFAVANDPPFWRRNVITIGFSELLDLLGYRRDRRGVHRSANRRRVASTLLALHFTHINVAQTKAGRERAFWAPLLASIGYDDMPADTSLSSFQKLSQGLPEHLTIEISHHWYRGVRDTQGQPGRDYLLIPRAVAAPRGGRPRGGKRSRSVDLLREYLQRCQSTVTETHVTLARSAWLHLASITNSNITEATRTLTQALERLCSEGVAQTFEPVPLPLDPVAPITVHWDA